MTPYLLSPTGGPADCAFHNGQIIVVWQDGPGPDAKLVQRTYSMLGVLRSSVTYPLGSDVGAFPRLLSAHDAVWLIYREGASLGGRAVLRRDGTEVWRSDGECGGNDPVCLGGDHFACQRAGDNAVMVGVLTAPIPLWIERIGAPTGISHLLMSGGVVLVDDARGAVSGVTRPSWAGDLVVGEHPDSGALVLAADGRRLRLWEGQDAYTPRLAYDALTGTYAAVTWGREGVRLATFVDADLMVAAPPPRPVWDATGATVDCGRFFDLMGSTVPREAEDGQCWQAHRVESRDDVYIVKGGDPRFVEILRLTDDDVRLAYDATDSRYPRAWRLDVIADGRSDAHWCPLIGTVGVLAVFFSARLIRRTEDGPSTSEPFPYAVAVEAHGRHIDYGGDVGVVDAVLVTRFEPHVGKTDDGYHELHHWAIVSGRAIGLVRYEEVRYGAAVSDRTFTFNRNAPARSVPLSSLIVHPIPDPPEAMPVPPVNPPVLSSPSLPPYAALQYVPTGLFLAVESDGRVVVNRPTADTYERLTVSAGELGGVSLRARTGKFLRATDPGEAKDLIIAATNDTASTYESFRVVPISDDTVSLMTFHGGVMQPDATGALVGRLAPLDQHAWRVVPMSAPPVVVPPSVPTPEPGEPVTPSPRRGQLREDGRSFADDAGPYLPVICHAGDLLSRWTRQPEAVRAMLADIAAAGYDGVRTWTVLHGDYWRGREVGPMHQGAAYWSHVAAFAAALRSAGLRWLVSQGDMLRALRAQFERRAFMADLARSLDRDLVLGVDAGNEAWQNGEAEPSRLRAAVDAFRAVLPCAVWSLTSPAGEERDALDPMAGSVYDVHGYRDGRSWDKIRHIFSLAYEVQPAKRLGIQSEPFGPGARVSVTANKHELTAGVMQLACAVSLLSRQAWVWFSGPGVVSDEAERMQDMPGFRETPAMRAALPADLMTFGSLVHGGASQKGRRIWAVPSTDETRCDHAMHADGRYVVAVYGPRWRDAMRERSCHVERRIDCGEAGFVEIGRLA